MFKLFKGFRIKLRQLATLATHFLTWGKAATHRRHGSYDKIVQLLLKYIYVMINGRCLKNIDDEITFFVELKWKCCLQLWWVADKRMMSWKTAKQGHVTMSDEDKKTYSSLVFILSCLLVVKNCNYYKNFF